MLEDIHPYVFNDDGLKELEETPRGINWPVVYLIHNDDCIYRRDDKCCLSYEPASKK